MEQSFASLTAKIVNYNKNILDLLNKLQTITTSTDSSVSVMFSDGTTNLNYQIPTIGYLMSEIQRVDNTLKSIYGIDSNSSYIQTSNSNSFRKIVLVNINKEPKTVSSLDVVSTFTKSNNNLFDALLDPMLSVVISLKNKIDVECRKVLVRRYIVDFDKNSDGSLTDSATLALSSFNTLYKGKNSIVYDDFIKWHSTTNGVYNPTIPYFDENMIDIQPNTLLYNGYFSVDKVEEDTINNKLWYYLDKLEYYNTSDGTSVTLKIDDELILNKDYSNSRYKVVEISYSNSLPKVRFQQVEGVEPIPVMKKSMKINSQVNYIQTVKVPIGYNERSVVFIKSYDVNSNMLGTSWSIGTAFWSNDLNLSSSDSDNGLSMDTFYRSVVNDYGEVLTDLVNRKKPVRQGVKPNAPVIKDANFKVVQINKHITDSVDINKVNTMYAKSKQLKTEIQQLNTAVANKTKEIRALGKPELVSELKSLNDKLTQKNKTYQTSIDETLSLSKGVVSVDDPIYHIRAFWDMPSAINEQEVIQFIVEYKSLSSDLNEGDVTTIKLTDSNASFSNWKRFKTDVRKRIYDAKKGVYTWVIENVSDADTPNINQLEIPIKQKESIQIRIKSISEVGYPDSILESDWSDTITVDFPSNLSKVVNDSQFILQSATQDDLVIKMKSELSSVISHVNDETIVNGQTYYHNANKILSGIKDSNSHDTTVYDYLIYLTNTINTLKEQINKTLGVLTVSIFRGSTEYIIKSDTQAEFNIECEDYLTAYTGDASGKSGRIYNNNIYTIKDFYVSIKNTSTDSSLGLLSNKLNNYENLYSPNVPQTFWVNERDELLFNNSTGKSQTQLNNQFIWQVNYVEKTETTITGTSYDISNSITTVDNGLVDVLSKSEYTLGYKGLSILNFNNYNSSLMEMSKWSDKKVTVASNNKLLTTVHPATQSLEYLTEKNQDLTRTLKAQDSIIIPLNIYFKMNSIDPTKGDGLNYDYINLNNYTTSVSHVKRVKFYLENKAENKAFIFTVKFNINRNRISIGRTISDSNLYKSAGNISAIKQ